MKSHAALYLQGRRQKAQKIQLLIKRHHSLAGMNVLEVGAGSGAISAHLAKVVGPNGRVVVVDVVDEQLF